MYPPVCAVAREATDPLPINTLSTSLRSLTLSLAFSLSLSHSLSLCLSLFSFSLTLSLSPPVPLSQVSPAPTSSSGPLWAPSSSLPSSWLWLPGVTSQCHWRCIQFSFILWCIKERLYIQNPRKCFLFLICSKWSQITGNCEVTVSLLVFTGAINRDATMSRRFTESSAGLLF